MMVKSSPLLETLPLDLDPNRLPQHVAVIMDGNGRWAKRRGMPRVMGHRRGVDVLRDLLRCCKDWGIPALTVYAFSTENWGRSKYEVDFLMALFEYFFQSELAEMMKEKVRVRCVGNLTALPKSLQLEISRSVADTQHNQDIEFTVAINYGGRQEIVQACRAIAQQAQQGELPLDAINESLFEQYLYTSGLGHPDLLIRTSGEMRLSNFLLWQVAYSEIYITKTAWPDFDRESFHQALLNYQDRDRRFGKVKS